MQDAPFVGLFANPIRRYRRAMACNAPTMKNVTLDVGHRETQRSEAVTLGPTEFHLRKGIEVDGVADPVRSAGYALEAV